MSKQGLSRRQWMRLGLTGAAGVAVGTHQGLFGALRNAWQGRANASGGRPCRFVFVVEGNCFEPTTLLAPSARSALDASLSAPVGDSRWWHRRYRHETVQEVASPDLGDAPALGPLRDAGLLSESSVLFGLSSKIIGGGHSGYHGSLSSARTIGGAPGGQTIDAFLASQSTIVGERPFDALRLGVGTGRPLDFGTCAFDEGRPAPMILQPETAYAVLFGAVSSSDAARDAFLRRGNLLDYARSEVQGAQAAFSGSAEEREKLETYLASLEELQSRHGRLLSLEDTLRMHAPQGPEDNPLYGSDDGLVQLEAQFELATAALLGELTNVVVLGSGTGNDFGLRYPSVSPVGRHDMHHGSSREPSLLAAIHEITRRQVQLIANLASRLAATPDVGGGTMLDRTLIVYVSDNGEQHHSTASDFPILLVGGRDLGVQSHGQSILYPGVGQIEHRQLSNLWNTVGHLAGQDLNDFGKEGPSRIAEGPLAEVLG